MVSEITEHEEYMDCVRDILCHPVFQSMDQYIQHGTTTCKTHCIQVSYLGYKLCKQLGGNWRSAARAGLLHDLFLYDWHVPDRSHKWHGLIHAKIALENARRYFSLNPKECDMIRKHMFPLNLALPRYKETVVIVLVDKYCSLTETLAYWGMQVQSFAGLFLRKIFS